MYRKEYLTLVVVDGSWSEWSPWDTCSQTCGSGHRSRTRECNNPPPQHGGRACDGDLREQVKCNVRPCPGKFLSFFSF